MYKFPSKINRSRFFSTLSMHHRSKWHLSDSTPVSPDFIFILWGQSTWTLVKAFQERGSSEGRGREGGVKAWKAGGRITLLAHAPGWRENTEYRKHRFLLKIYTSAKSSRTKKKHRNGFLLLIYSFLEGQRTGACTELTEKSMQPSAQWLRWSSALTQVVFLNNVYVAEETSTVRVGKHKLLQENSFLRINWWWTIQRLSILKIQTPSTY